MRPLLPSLKENKRYVLFKVHSDAAVNKSQCSDAISSAVLRFLGELGCAKAGITFIKENYDPAEKTGIIRVNTKYIDELKVSIGSIKQIGPHNATFDVVKVSGNIGKLKSKNPAKSGF